MAANIPIQAPTIASLTVKKIKATNSLGKLCSYGMILNNINEKNNEMNTFTRGSTDSLENKGKTTNKTAILINIKSQF